jgi:hypothetical protein
MINESSGSRFLDIEYGCLSRATSWLDHSVQGGSFLGSSRPLRSILPHDCTIAFHTKLPLFMISAPKNISLYCNNKRVLVGLYMRIDTNISDGSACVHRVEHEQTPVGVPAPLRAPN